MLSRYVKTFIYLCADIIGLNALFRYRNRSKVRVLMYHSVTHDSLHPHCWTVISRDRFTKHMEHVAKRYCCLHSRDFEALVSGRTHSVNDAVLITFDDGLMNNAEMAEPILKAHSLSAVCFVCPELSERGEKIWADRAWEGVTFGTLSRIDLTPLGGPSISLPAEPHRRALLAQSIIEQMKLLLDSERLQWMSTLQSQGALDSRATEPSVFTLMTLSDIRTMAARGTIAIGSHTMTHPILSRLLIERQKHEIGECKKTLARAGVSSVPLFAYPNGKPIDFTEDTVSILKQEGYCAAFTTTEEMFSASADTWRVPRLLIGHDTNIWEFKAKLSGLEGAIRRLFSVAKQ